MVNSLVMSNRRGGGGVGSIHAGTVVGMSVICLLLWPGAAPELWLMFHPLVFQTLHSMLTRLNAGGKTSTNITQCAAVEFVDLWMSPLSGAET